MRMSTQCCNLIYLRPRFIYTTYICSAVPFVIVAQTFCSLLRFRVINFNLVAIAMSTWNSLTQFNGFIATTYNCIISKINSYRVFLNNSYRVDRNVNNYSFIYIISYDATIYYSLLICGFILTISSYISLLFIPLLVFFILFPLSNPYLISNSSHQPEYLYVSLLSFIFLEILLFIAYFWFYFHNYSYSYYPMNQHILMSSNLYMISGLILSLLSIYLSIILLSIFIILTSLEFSNSLDIVYINDNPLTVVQLTIVFLHLMHLVVGILLILLELVYPHYYHFIEVIWLIIGYSIYLN